MCFCCRSPSGKGFKAALPLSAEGPLRSPVTEAGVRGRWCVDMHELAPEEEGKVSHHLWGWVNAHNIWLVTFDQSIPRTAAPMSCQSTASCSCWSGMVLWSISSFVQPLLLLLCLVSLLGLCTWEFCFLSQSARVVCDFSRRIVPLGIFMAARWDVTALWGPAEQTEPLPDLCALGWQPLSLFLALEVKGSPRNQSSSR